jgi:hypothetical protein
MNIEDYFSKVPNVAEYGELGRQIWDYVSKFEQNGYVYTDEDRLYAYRLVQRVCLCDEMSDEIKVIVINSITTEPDFV